MNADMKLEELWYSKSALVLLLLPLSWLFSVLVTLRRFAYRVGLFKVHRLPVPVIVVGNLTVGGTGKTPLVTYLVETLRKAGLKPGIVSRGYGGAASSWPQQVRQDSDPSVVGDEAVLLARRCACPMTVGPNRPAAARALLAHNDCDVIISDDGLQHYALGRDIEIAVIDGVRRFGNNLCLPAGPLREPLGRLKSVDLQVVNGLAGRGEFSMQITGTVLQNLEDNEKHLALTAIRGKSVHAVAGIGNPRRFFDPLKQHGLKPIEHTFPDHHDFVAYDILFEDEMPVLMTEKDAVKCKRFAKNWHWYLPVSAVLDDSFEYRVNKLLKKVQHG